VQADFRSLDLGETFDAAICGFDSINYLDDPAELGNVFRSVAAHLRYGGFFLLDAIDRAAMQSLALVDVHYAQREPRHAMISYFDEATGKSRTLVVFADGFEEHLRVPIDPPDVAAAAERARLMLLEFFSSVNRLRTFYLLRKPVSAADLSAFHEDRSVPHASATQTAHSAGLSER
jgi:SAM-dependent methyltransferase